MKTTGRHSNTPFKTRTQVLLRKLIILHAKHKILITWVTKFSHVHRNVNKMHHMIKKETYNKEVKFLNCGTDEFDGTGPV